MAEKQKRGGPEVPPSAMDQFAHFLDDEELKKEAAKQREREKSQKAEGAEKPESKEQGKTIEQEEQELREKAAEEIRRIEAGAKEAQRIADELKKIYEGAAQRAGVAGPEAQTEMEEIDERAHREIGVQKEKTINEIGDVERISLDLYSKKDVVGYTKFGWLPFKKQPKEIKEFEENKDEWLEEEDQIKRCEKAIEESERVIAEKQEELARVKSEKNITDKNTIKSLELKKERLESGLKLDKSSGGRPKEIQRTKEELAATTNKLNAALKVEEERRKKERGLEKEIIEEQKKISEYRISIQEATIRQIDRENRARELIGQEPVPFKKPVKGKEFNNRQKQRGGEGNSERSHRETASRKDEQEGGENKSKEKERAFLDELQRLQNTPRLRASSDALRTRIIQINQQYSGDPLSRNTANGRVIQQDIMINTLDGGRFRISLRESDGYYGIHYEISPQGGSSSQGKARKP